MDWYGYEIEMETNNLLHCVLLSRSLMGKMGGGAMRALADETNFTCCVVFCGFSSSLIVTLSQAE